AAAIRRVRGRGRTTVVLMRSARRPRQRRGRDLDQRSSGHQGVRQAHRAGEESLQPVRGGGGSDPAGARGAPGEGGLVIWRREDAEAAQAHDTGGRRMAEQSGEVTIVGHGAKLEGTVVSAGSLRIDGQVKGQINADGDVMLTPSSQVEADIRAQNVAVAGRFKGNIHVKGRAEIAKGGRV